MKNHHRKSTSVGKHRKPKMYRSESTDRTSKIADWNPSNNDGGGSVKGIVGPESSVGTVGENPAPNQGMKKEIKE